LNVACNLMTLVLVRIVMFVRCKHKDVVLLGVIVAGTKRLLQVCGLLVMLLACFGVVAAEEGDPLTVTITAEEFELGTGLELKTGPPAYIRPRYPEGAWAGGKNTSYEGRLTSWIADTDLPAAALDMDESTLFVAPPRNTTGVL